MKQLFYRTFLVGCLSLFAISCFEDEEEVSSICDYDQLSALANAYSEASIRFAQSGTYSDCLDAKSKGYAFLNRVKACPEAGYGVAELEAALANIDCESVL
jgi:hypothetical protein